MVGRRSPACAGPQLIRAETVPRPVPGAGEVLIHVAATPSTRPGDRAGRRGRRRRRGDRRRGPAPRHGGRPARHRPGRRPHGRAVGRGGRRARGRGPEPRAGGAGGGGRPGALVRPGGLLVSVAAPVLVPPGGDATAVHLVARNDARQLARLVPLVDSGAPTVPTAASCPLDEPARVHRDSEAGPAKGKITLAPDRPGPRHGGRPPAATRRRGGGPGRAPRRPAPRPRPPGRSGRGCGPRCRPPRPGARRPGASRRARRPAAGCRAPR